MEHVVRVYVWLKVVGPKDGGEMQLLPAGNMAVFRGRIPSRKGGPATLSALPDMHMGAGITAVTETAKYADSPLGFFFHDLPPDTTLEQATQWITTEEGRNWVAGASAWILLYSVASASLA
jgi:hypothetical protein